MHTVWTLPATVGGLIVAGLLLLQQPIAAEDAEKPAEPPRIEPLPQAVPETEGVPQTPDMIALGKLLFFDPRLSGNNDMSCATCHLPEKGFGDGLPTGKGHEGKRLSRNTQGLYNLAWYDSYFWDGRAGTLEEQALGPIQNPDEMHQELKPLIGELQQVPEYRRRFRAVFDSDVTETGIARALAAFQRTLVTGPSRVDRFLAGERDALNSQERNGLELFRGAADCIRCHHGPLLSDNKFHRLGVSFDDRGRAAVTGVDEDRYRFRTPSLRNIADTGPYMHDGSLKTLDEVVAFYYRGVPSQTPDGLPLDAEALSGQSYSEVADIVAFLKALSGAPPQIEQPEIPPSASGD